MTVLGLLAGLAVFVLILHLARAPEIAGRALSTAGEATRTLRAQDLSDDEKERRTRAAAVCLFAGFAAIAAVLVLALAAGVGLVWTGAVAGLYDLDRAIAVASGPGFIVGSSLGAVVLWIALDRWRQRMARRGA